MKDVTLQLTVRVENTVDDSTVAQQIGSAIDPDGWNWDVGYPEVVSSVPAEGAEETAS